VYIIMNLRALKQRCARMTQIFDAGAFKLGWGWPPASRAANVVAEIAEVEAEPNSAIIQAEAARVSAAVTAVAVEPPPEMAPVLQAQRRSPRAATKRARSAASQATVSDKALPLG
jgi:hypothetical protein